MRKRLIRHLFLSLLIFSILLVLIVSVTNRQLIRSDIENRVTDNHQLIQETIVHDMQKVDFAHYYLEKNIEETLESHLHILRDKYEEESDFSKWDFQALKAQFDGAEIYILNKENVIKYTSFKADLHLDFKTCCTDFTKLLDERRQTDDFYSDALDISTQTGDMRKYSYLATSDHQYMLELSIDPSESQLYNAFNYFDSAKQLQQRYEDLQNVYILNREGFYLNIDTNNERALQIQRDAPQFETYFKEALVKNKQVTVVQKGSNGIENTYQFTPYKSKIELGDSTTRVIFAHFTNKSELALLADMNNRFYISLSISILFAIMMFFIIMRILSNPIRLAMSDPLTGIANRATYAEKMNMLLKQEHDVGLILIDVDNFKMINDTFGHHTGDILLKNIALSLKKVTPKKNITARLGGDEFAIIIRTNKVEELTRIAKNVLNEIISLKELSNDPFWQNASVSIGGTIYKLNEDDENTFYGRADDALYLAKSSGKNCFKIL